MKKTASICMGLSALIGLLAVASTGCDVVFPGQDAPWQSAFGLAGDNDHVTLRIENQSGLPVDVEAIFTSLDQEVRRTSRRLSATGGDAFEEIVPTGAEVVTVVARRIIADKPTTAATDDILQSQTFQRGVDFTGTDTILFAVLPIEEPTPPNPLPMIDCNDNGLADPDEITADPSTDCNGDEILDECQSLADCNENSIPDECENLTDCNDDGTPDDCQDLTDCDESGIPDECENLTDCNDDGIPDDCQHLPDYNENGTPDECEMQGDLDGDGMVTMDDLPLFLQLLLAGGSQDFPPGADINGDGVLDGRDIQPILNLLLAQS